MKKGFSTLFIVIILGSLSLALVLMLATSSLLVVKSSGDVKKSYEAKSLIMACAEISLEAIRENNNFTGSSSVTLSSNACNYTVTNTGGTTRMIVVSSIINDVTRSLNIITSSFNPLVISSWQEI